MSKSLSVFFREAEEATLSNCDLEKLHLSGAIQSAGYLLAVDPRTNIFVAASENVSEILGEDTLIGKSVEEILPEISASISDFASRDVEEHYMAGTIEHWRVRGFDCIAHKHAGLYFLEFLESSNIPPEATRHALWLLKTANRQIQAAKSFQDACEIAVNRTREITGYERVKIYRFLEDWSGQVIAESREEDMPAYIGLCFPDTDIPKQARELYQILPYRIVSSADDKNSRILLDQSFFDDNDVSLDLTWSLLRSVSPIHSQYLRNMGVASSFSVGMTRQDELWGLLVCHSRRPRLLPFEFWDVARDMVDTLMLRLDREHSELRMAGVRKLRNVEASIATALRANVSMQEAIRSLAHLVGDLIPSSGFAFQDQHNTHVVGETPSFEFIRELIAWAAPKPKHGDVFYTTALHHEWSHAAAQKDVACGVLIKPVLPNRNCHLIWFRKPRAKTVKWAGKPEGKTDHQGNQTLQSIGPRNSFDIWLSHHDDESEPWSQQEVEIAGELHNEVMDLLASQASELKLFNDDLKQFLRSAAYDIDSPLRAIVSILTLIKDCNRVTEERQLERILNGAICSANDLTLCTIGLLSIPDFVEKDIHLAPIDPTAVVRISRVAPFSDVEKPSIELKIEPLPEVVGHPVLIAMLFLNLVSNSLDRRVSDEKVRVCLSGKIGHQTVDLVYRDNCAALSRADAEQMAKLFGGFDLVLHKPDFGIGFAACKRAMDLQGGKIRLTDTGTNGVEFLMTFQRPHRWTL